VERATVLRGRFGAGRLSPPSPLPGGGALRGVPHLREVLRGRGQGDGVWRVPAAGELLQLQGGHGVPELALPLLDPEAHVASMAGGPTRGPEQPLAEGLSVAGSRRGALDGGSSPPAPGSRQEAQEEQDFVDGSQDPRALRFHERVRDPPGCAGPPGRARPAAKGQPESLVDLAK
jgi:hypothetical protein